MDERPQDKPIPPADPDVGYKVAIDRAIDALDDAINTTRTPGLTDEQRGRIETLAKS